MKKSSHKNRTGKELVLWKMTNMLRATAKMAVESTTLTPDQKKSEMETVEQLMSFINDYDNNIKLLKTIKQKPLTDEQMEQIEKYDIGYQGR